MLKKEASKVISHSFSPCGSILFAAGGVNFSVAGMQAASTSYCEHLRSELIYDSFIFPIQYITSIVEMYRYISISYLNGLYIISCVLHPVTLSYCISSIYFFLKLYHCCKTVTLYSCVVGADLNFTRTYEYLIISMYKDCIETRVLRLLF